VKGGAEFQEASGGGVKGNQGLRGRGKLRAHTKLLQRDKTRLGRRKDREKQVSALGEAKKQVWGGGRRWKTFSWTEASQGKEKRADGSQKAGNGNGGGR